MASPAAADQQHRLRAKVQREADAEHRQDPRGSRCRRASPADAASARRDSDAPARSQRSEQHHGDADHYLQLPDELLVLDADVRVAPDPRRSPM